MAAIGGPSLTPRASLGVLHRLRSAVVALAALLLLLAAAAVLAAPAALLAFPSYRYRLLHYLDDLVQVFSNGNIFGTFSLLYIEKFPN